MLTTYKFIHQGRKLNGWMTEEIYETLDFADLICQSFGYGIISKDARNYICVGFDSLLIG